MKISNEAFVDMLAQLQADDVAFHGMLYPDIYPTDYDRRMYARFLAGEQPKLEDSFFDLCGLLSQRNVQHRWLRPLRLRKQAQSTEALAAQIDYAQALGAVTCSDFRVVDFDAAIGSMRHERLDISKYGRLYLEGVASHVPKASFWHIEQGQPLPRSVIDMLHYTGTVFDGHDIYPADQDAEMSDWVQFWEGIHADERMAIPVGQLAVKGHNKP